MKFLKIVFFVYLVIFSGISLASNEKTEDCSEIEGYKVEEDVHGGKIEFLWPYSIEEVSNELPPFTFKISSIFLSTESKVTNSSNNEFVEQSETEVHINELLLIIMIGIMLCSLMSGCIGRTTLLKYRCASISIFVGMIAGIAFGVGGGFTLGLVAGIMISIQHESADDKLPCGLAGAIAGALTGALTGVFAEDYGTTHAITLEWLGFCLVMILLEYLVVLLRRKYQQKVNYKT